MTRRQQALVVLATIVSLVITGCGIGGSGARTIAICSSLPLSGGTNARAVSMRDAVEQAFAERGYELQLGSDRYEIVHIALDDARQNAAGEWNWSTEQERVNARAAIDEHDCVAYIGTYNSGAAKIAMPILNRVRMAMVSPGNTYEGLTKPGKGIGGEPWIYSPLGPEERNYCRVVPTDDLQAPAAALYARNVLGLERAYVLHDLEVYGQGVAENFAAAAEEIGLDVVGGPEGIDVRAEDYSDLAATIMAEDPDVVYFGGVTSNHPALVLAALRRAGYEGVFMGADGIAEARFVEEANAENDARVFATLVGLPPSELQGEGAEWRERYLARYGREPDAFAAPSYEAALVVLDAIERAGRPERRAVRDALATTRDFDGILGPWSFDENCDTTATTISMNQVQGDDFSFVDVIAAE